MTAINQENWDVLATQIVRFSDALGEDFYDRPGTVDEEFFKQSILDLRGLYTVAFESYLPKAEAEPVTKLTQGNCRSRRHPAIIPSRPFRALAKSMRDFAGITRAL